MYAPLYVQQSIEKAKVDFFVKKAVRSAADFNAQFMRERREERRAYIDLQTLVSVEMSIVYL
jgi:hypothetical protein